MPGKNILGGCSKWVECKKVTWETIGFSIHGYMDYIVTAFGSTEHEHNTYDGEKTFTRIPFAPVCLPSSVADVPAAVAYMGEDTFAIGELGCCKSCTIVIAFCYRDSESGNLTVTSNSTFYGQDAGGVKLTDGYVSTVDNTHDHHPPDDYHCSSTSNLGMILDMGSPVALGNFNCADNSVQVMLYNNIPFPPMCGGLRRYYGVLSMSGYEAGSFDSIDIEQTINVPPKDIGDPGTLTGSTTFKIWAS